MKIKLAKIKPIKSLIKGFKNWGGRNTFGRITVAHQGGGHKRLYRQIDFKRKFKEGLITNVEYDPNRTSFLARLTRFKDTKLEYSYILCPQNVKILDNIVASSENNKNTLITAGDSFSLSQYTIGDFLHNVENSPGQGGIFARSAGTYVQLIQKETSMKNFCKVKLPSGEQRYILKNCVATFGKVSNLNHQHIIIGKAGRSRWLNKRPSVRGVAMNPVDHPHGGGQGKTSGGRPSVTPQGWPTKGSPTRKKKKNSTLIALHREKKNKKK